MILGIDASNIRQGGGVTHLVEILRAGDPQKSGFSKVIVWGNLKTLTKIPSKAWIEKRHDRLLEGRLLSRLWWQYRKFGREARKAECKLLFAPGGSATGRFKPFVTMCRNMLPFEWQEMRRYGVSWMFLRNLLLRFVQARSFKKSDGLIFLTTYAQTTVEKAIGSEFSSWTSIPHGVSERFFIPPRSTRLISECSKNNPLRILYVSIIDVYKHQWHLVKAVSLLYLEGYSIALDLVGPPTSYGIERLESIMNEVDPGRAYIRYLGEIEYQMLHEYYRNADINIFASSCENMPNILLEGMASGVPMACSDRGPMPEILQSSGVYFNPENPESIADALRELIDNPGIRMKNAQSAFQRAKQYSWQKCANDTFAYLAKVARMGT